MYTVNSGVYCKVLSKWNTNVQIKRWGNLGFISKLLATGLIKPMDLPYHHPLHQVCASSWVSYLCDPLLCDAVRCHVQLQQQSCVRWTSVVEIIHSGVIVAHTPMSFQHYNSWLSMNTTLNFLWEYIFACFIWRKREYETMELKSESFNSEDPALTS